MDDIRQELDRDGCINFVAESDRGRDWMVQTYHESAMRYSDSTQERAEATQFLKRAKDVGLTVSVLFSTETCAGCGKRIPEGDVNYRPGRTTKILAADGTEQPGNPLALEFTTYCPECVETYDRSN